MIPPLVPRFPLLVAGTHLVLVEASNDRILAFWQVAADCPVPSALGFTRAEAPPVPVLRLRRLTPRGAEPIQEVRVPSVAPRGAGVQSFVVGPEPGRYDAELGLADRSGGWLMLARSSALDYRARVDVRLSGGAPSSVESGGSGARFVGDADRSGPAAPSLGPDPAPGPRSASPTGSLERSYGGPAQGFDPGLAPLPGSGGVGKSGEAPTSEQSVRAASGSPITDGNPVDRAGEMPARCAGHPGPASGTTPRTSDDGRGSIPPIRYGQAPRRFDGVWIEAELRINGSAAPGSEIDLFGRSYRVGPGGRFQLSIRVDDEALIRRALELNPPILPERADGD